MGLAKRQNRRRGGAERALIGVGALALLGAAPIAAFAQSATPTASSAPYGVLESAAGLVACAETDLGSLPADAKPTTRYDIVSEKSAARYRVMEELASIGINEAVGETNAIIGQIGFDETGRPLACSRFDVDLRTLKSDEARRDNFLYNNTLETETYPLATFVLRTVEGLDGPLTEGQEIEFTLVGDLTAHGVTRLVAWNAAALREGDVLTGKAETTFQMPDFQIEPPRVPSVVSLEETVRLEIDITAQATE